MGPLDLVLDEGVLDHVVVCCLFHALFWVVAHCCPVASFFFYYERVLYVLVDSPCALGGNYGSDLCSAGLWG